MVTDEPFGFIPVCLRCGAEGDKIPVAEHTSGPGEPEAWSWRAGAIWAILALDQHKEECDARARV